MLRSIKYYLTILIRDAHFWQRTDVSGNEIKIRFFFSLQKWIILLLSAILALFTPSFSDNFIGYLLASFSIFIALFLQLIISIYSRYSEMIIDTSTEHKKVFAVQIKNFSKQFTSIMSYAILIAIVCLVLLSISLITNYFNQPDLYNTLFNDLNFCYSFNALSSLFYKIILFYFLLNFIYLLIYGLSSFYSFMRIDLDSMRIKKD